ncbi:transglutaminase-like cysteine peptidase [Hoeflea sp. YIM 152468]|uniref:transglutaminase-like cysteine peptidase n=1 Tax=Hoeflea sp. YIM 152468 TaxID=3031759 RepID=UPI0023DBE718|nr:transglutaminase-like cysteine peptidase [Hoeflea sp. YIM 152468]MDF1609425.1 transglutaminase-like cysteine peptidase [Hoeflea sp. YIM 152468]
MSTPLFLLVALALWLSLLTPSHASTWLKTGKQTTRPYGHVEYCTRKPFDCRSRRANSKLQSARLTVLSSVNQSVNRSIKPTSDKIAFGRKEFWTSKARSGDCEDFALAKRAKLMRKGFNASHLLLTMGYARGEAHTVLVVRTRDGDYVLDNLENEVQPVQSARMSFRKIQSPDHGGHWLKITGKTGKQPR